jgi:hypothetical protein
MTQKPKRPPEWSSAIQDLNAKLQQLAERITRLEELVMGAVVCQRPGKLSSALA